MEDRRVWTAFDESLPAEILYPCRFESDCLADSALQLRLPAARIVPLRNG
jgi:hypothetical protein